MQALPQTAPPPYTPPPLAVQLIGQLTFGVVAIVATVMAFDASWVAGVAVVSILGWIGFGGRHDRFRGRKAGRADAPVCTSAATPEPTGNAAFDAYRADVLKRLEDEQKSFVAFLDRLRAARDQSELDSFLADRMRGGPAQPSDDAAPRSGLY